MNHGREGGQLSPDYPIDGSIVQMSMNYWVYEIATILKESIGYGHEILTMSKETSLEYISSSLKRINLKSFIEGIFEEEAEDEELLLEI